MVLATKTDGTLWAWGANNHGQLGQNQGASPNSDRHRSSPTQIPGTAWDTCSMAGSSALATRTDGTVWSWGYAGYGHLGHNNRISYSSPTQIPGADWDYARLGNGEMLTGYKIDQA